MDLFYTPDKHPFYLMAKPVGAACNLDCTYCYYLEKAQLFPQGTNQQMSDLLLKRYVKTYIESQARSEIMFTWHGGEALLRGLPFYKKALDYQLYYARQRGIRIDNSLQTNGTLLTDEWCEFFKNNNFLVGISIDGPAHCHDYYRKNRSGMPSFERVYKGLKLLQKHGVEYNILSVVNDYNVRFPVEVYDFFKQSGAKYIQFTPIVEQFHPGSSGQALRLTTPKYAEGATLTPWSVGAEAYGDFLCAVFDEWVKTDVGTYFVINFDAMLANWMGVPPPLCVFAETCGHAMAMEHNGDVYACDHYVFPQYKRGNIHQDSLLKMAYSQEQVKFGNDKRDNLPRQCRSCEFLFVCYGECPKNRIIETEDGESGLNYLCKGFKKFYRHIAPYMELMATEIRHQRPPSNVMNHP